jgi:hypothetical protein
MCGILGKEVMGLFIVKRMDVSNSVIMLKFLFPSH